MEEIKNKDDKIEVTSVEKNPDGSHVPSPQIHGKDGRHVPADNDDTLINIKDNKKNQPHRSFESKEDLTNFVNKAIKKEKEKILALEEQNTLKDKTIKELNNKIFQLQNKKTEKIIPLGKQPENKMEKSKVKDHVI